MEDKLNMKSINPKEVRNIFDYKNGNLYWKIDASKSVKKGQIAGYIYDSRRGLKTPCLRYRIGFCRKYYLRSRLVWAWHTGQWPVKQIDHIDNNTLNDKIENLRDVSNGENSINRRAYGEINFKNIQKRKNGKFFVRIVSKKIPFYIGTFEKLQDAIKERDKFIKKNLKERMKLTKYKSYQKA